MSIAKHGKAIRTVEEWRESAPPKSPSQWVDDRSAKEVARAWAGLVSPALPAEVEALLRTDDAFGPVLEWSAEPEAKVRFDAHAGEPRNTDLLVHATDASGPFVLSVEAKADEPFGETVARAAAGAAARRTKNPRSRGTERLSALCQALLGSTYGDAESEADGALRYQLLTATAGALAAAVAVRADRAVLVIHEFRSTRASPARHTANAKALDTFVARLTGGATRQAEPGRLYRLPTLPGVPLFSTQPRLFIGKVLRVLPSRPSP